MSARLGARWLGAIVAVAALSGAVAVPEAEAQAWIREPGTAYVNLKYRFLASDTFFGADGNTEPLRDYRQHAIGFYAEVGLVERWLELVVGGELLRRNVLLDQGAVTGVGDLRVGLFTGLLQEGPHRLSLGVQVGVPTGDDNPGAPGNDGAAQIVAQSLPTGDGEVDVTWSLSYGHGFRLGTTADAWTTASIGYALRNARRPLRGDDRGDLDGDGERDRFTDQVVYSAELGGRPLAVGWDRLYGLVRWTGAVLLGDARQASGFAGVGDGISFLALGAEVGVRVWRRLVLSAGVDGPLLATSLPGGATVQGSVAWTFE